jgi:hypothetical protein
MKTKSVPAMHRSGRWGNFLLLAQVPAPGASESWLDRFVAEFSGAEHVVLGFNGKDGSVADFGWFAGHGFNAKERVSGRGREPLWGRRRNGAGQSHWSASGVVA